MVGNKLPSAKGRRVTKMIQHHLHADATNQTKLVGGFNPSEKYSSKWVHLP